MISKLLFALLATVIAEGQLAQIFREDVPGDETQLATDDALAASLNSSLNETFGDRADITFGAFVERVTLSKCPRYQSYLPYFYDGFVVNSRSWTESHDDRFSSIARVDNNGDAISSSAGAYPGKGSTLFHSWEMLAFDRSYSDIRTRDPGTLVLETWNAMQQIYIPLYMSRLETGKAYMLHIYPQAGYLNDPSEYSYTDGVVWARGDWNRLYRLEIDIAGMLRNLSGFTVLDHTKFITAHGVVKTWVIGGPQKVVAWPDSYQVSLKASTQGPANEYICHDADKEMDITVPEFQAILKQHFTWL